MALTHLRPAGLPHPPTYSQAVVATGSKTIYVSGQVAMNEQGESVGVGDLAAQTEQVMRNLSLALEAAGASFEHVAKLTTFVVNYTPEMRPVIAAVRAGYLPSDPPASTLVGVSALAHPDWLIEIEAIAVI